MLFRSEARAWVVETASGRVIGSERAGERLPIASITKLMTVMVALERHRLSDVISVDPRAARVGQETIGVRAGERLTVADLVRGALIQSANDAAVALALGTSPDLASFAALMNERAAALGLRDTHFVRPDGLDTAGAYSTARDVTTLARRAMEWVDRLLPDLPTGATAGAAWRDHGQVVVVDDLAEAYALADDYAPAQVPQPALPGPTAKVALEMAVGGFRRLGKASDYDAVIAGALADVLSGGDTDITETGATLKANGNHIIAEIFTSNPQLIANA